MYSPVTVINTILNNLWTRNSSHLKTQSNFTMELFTDELSCNIMQAVWLKNVLFPRTNEVIKSVANIIECVIKYQTNFGRVFSNTWYHARPTTRIKKSF